MAYQRALSSVASARLIAAITEQLDWRLFLPLVVSRRADGRMFIVDGQHRWEGAKARGDIIYAPCTVIEGLTQGEEAKLFYRLNRNRKPVTKIDLWRSEVMAGDENALQLADIIARAGLVVVDCSRDRLRPGQINTIGPIQTAIKLHGPVIARDALGAVARAFRTASITAPGMFIAAACAMIRAGRSAEDVERIFARKRPVQWIELARTDPVYLKGATGMTLALRKAIDRGGAPVRPSLAAVAPSPVASERVADVGIAASAEVPPISAPVGRPSFEDQLARIERGEARVVPVFKPSKPPPDKTLGGVASGL